MTRILHGEPVASTVRDAIERRLSTLRADDVVPTLGTVLVSDDDAQRRFMDLKHEACDDLGIETRHHRFGSDATESVVLDAVDELVADPAVDAIFVQTPLPEQVSELRVRRHIDPAADVDCFHPTNLGALVTGDPRFVPATPAAVQTLLAAYEVPVAGRDVVIVGRSTVIGKPLANLLLADAPGGNATVTVCHSATRNLGEQTRRADVLVTACGVPGLVDGGMLSEGVVVVDVSTNPTPDGTVVGDVTFESARTPASAITPVPGGIGPVTIAKLLENVVTAATQQRRDANGGGHDGPAGPG